MRSNQQSKRRPKPVNQVMRKTLRYDRAVADAVEHLQREMAKNAGVNLTAVDASGVPEYTKALDFSKAVRMLVVENHKAALVLAGQPEAWPTSQTVQLPMEIWDGLTQCRNNLSHSQGSLYAMLRKVNFAEGEISREEFREAYEAVMESKQAVARMEATLVQFLNREDDEAVAQSSHAER